ncbi:hypothetical protein DMH25_07890 [Streptomyces sp. WAC 01325]|uniref:hypothetical protein n=1 Tax=Streptomyces sp. WAC 01325 TaxID=2203202 RepID=UPI000F898F29|nr:hypothetical protein [Streptomyces sp. WAC 01325]MCZ4607355.1 hypothetical protein [Streptomyces sp. Lzd4kr]RSN14846.1 hypothetical protein DMH25_07890 [Streptomyces sp. WAC 01325]
MGHDHPAAMSPCINCGRLFLYDPERVVSVLVDPETGRYPEPSRRHHAVRVPACHFCVRAANVERRKRGLPLGYEGDTYADLEARLAQEERWR